MSISAGRTPILKKSNRTGHHIAIGLTDGEYEQLWAVAKENNTTIAQVTRVALNRVWDIQFRDRLDWNGATKESKI